jgi:hypothetical protein
LLLTTKPKPAKKIPLLTLSKVKENIEEELVI